MTKIASSADTVLANITRFQDELEDSTDLQDRLAYARAWYAYKDNKGRWQFGPSKFVGYEGLDAGSYIKTAQDNDGRRTEAQLQQWFTVVEPGSDLHDEISADLFTFLAFYGKTPSTKMRIGVLNDVYKEHFGEPNMNAAIVELIVAVAKTLPADLAAKLRLKLAA